MYRSHFGLRQRPFELDDDPAYYFPAPQEAASVTLSYALEQQQGLAMLTGEPGTGKTTLLRRLIEKLVPHYQGVLLSDTATIGGSLAKQFANALGLKCTRELLPIVLRDHLAQQAEAGHMVILMVDEAQNLTAKQFEEVRFLSNLSLSGTRLMQIFLVGQPPLEHRLARASLEALRQRVAVRVSLLPLDFEQTASYIEFRLGIAGAERPNLFTAGAIRRIFEDSRGIPRLVNILCERALLVAYTDGLQWLDRGTVETAIADLKSSLPEESFPSPEASEPGETGEVRKDLARIERKLDRLLAAARKQPPSARQSDQANQISHEPSRPRLVHGPPYSPGD